MLSYIPILIAGVSAVVAALLSTEIDRDDPTKRTSVFRKPTKAGWFLIVLTVVATAVGIRIERMNQDHDKVTEERSTEIKLALNDAKEDAKTKGRDLEETKASLSKALTALDSQAKFAKSQADLASNRAKQQSLELGDAKTDLRSEQQKASQEIQDQQERHQAEIKSQQELIEASLLGQQTEAPQAALLLGTTFVPTGEEKKLFDSNQIDGGAIASLIFGDLFAQVGTDSVMDVHANFAALEPTVRDPTEETVEYGWKAWLQVTKAHKTEVIFAGGGPNELFAPRPSFQLRYRGRRLVILLQSRLTKPVSSALLFMGPSIGQDVASFEFSVRGLDENTITSLANHLPTIFVGGEEWTLINSSSGMCAMATLEKPTIQYDKKAAAIKAAWHVKETNRLVLCPANFFISRSH